MMELPEKVINGLTNIQNVNCLSDETFLQIVELVVSLSSNNADSRGLTIKKIHSTKSDVAKSMIVNISCLFVEAARHNLDKLSIIKFLQTANIVGQRVEKLCEVYINNKDEIQMQLQSIGHSMPHIVDIDWRLNHCMKHSTLSSTGSLSYHVRLTTKQYTEIKYITFTCTMQQLQEILYKVKDAIRHLERVANT